MCVGVDGPGPWSPGGGPAGLSPAARLVQRWYCCSLTNQMSGFGPTQMMNTTCVL